MKLFAAFLIVSMVAIAGTTQERSAPLKIVHGTVTDYSGKPVSGSVVYLRDDTTNDVRTQITGHTGHYRFSGISYRTDYRIHAEREGMTSRVHRISAHNTDKTVSLHLKLNRKKADLLTPAPYPGRPEVRPLGAVPSPLTEKTADPALSFF